MVKVGSYNRLSILRFLKAGAYLDDGAQGILLPTRFVPPGAKEGQELEVFVYHDSEDRLIATTQKAKACVGEIALLKVVGISPQGAFLDWGLMKDLFVPRSKQLMGMRLGGSYLVKLYIDERTGRVAATEKFENELSNEQLTVKEKDQVQLLTYRRTEIGYVMIINNQHTGLLHFNEIFKELAPGDQLEGFIKEIKPGNKIDLVAGRPGYQRVEEEKDKILALLQDNNGYLPYYDKSAPEEIYAFFGMSKKTFKMATGALYKERKISLEKTGIRLL
ncbi:MAG TPA: S1-like domain-containing RNA-binding protein [Chitinophagaceae bacterium]|jgi:predicted RNA-binding protein (virulence factor B family)|nr:S1-like domain-containing RNA-binding protein [Chitinophagaceae bacterium]